jgi:hypothetical protein
MPTLDEKVKTSPTQTVSGTTTPTATTTPAATVPVVDATVVTDPTEEKTPKAKKEKPAKVKTEAKEKPAKKTDAEKAEKKADSLIRPPMEQIAKDVEDIILDKSVAGHKLKKLEYKCGKIIYGLPVEDGKDFRVIAIKARKKSKSVEGKSRCIFFFGITDDHSKILKDVPGTKSTNFGRCSVQCKKPIELVLDKQAYKDHFKQDADFVVKQLEKLIDLAVEQKTTEHEALMAKVAAKKDAADVAKKKATKKESAPKKDA